MARGASISSNTVVPPMPPPHMESHHMRLAAIAADSGPRSAPLQPSISTGTRACAAATSGAIAAGASVITITRSTHAALATRSTVRVSTGRPPNSLSR